MSSFRNHRIVIASLFLPTIAVLGESGPPTPEKPIQNNVDGTISAVTDRLVAGNNVLDPTKPKALKPSISAAGHNRQLSASGPLKSIVEDLKDKVSIPFLDHSRVSLTFIRPDIPRHLFVHQLTKPLIHSQNSPGSH
jgi:trehalose 6-phosphate synthase/phosphatase